MLDDPVFWSTFWGGLLSLAVFGVVSAALVWVISKITAPFRKKPSWLLDTDSHGSSTLTYNRRRPCQDGRIQFMYRGAWVDPTGFESYEGEYTRLHYMPKGTKSYLPNEVSWDEVRIAWRECPESIATGRAPKPNTQAEIFTEYRGRRSLRSILLSYPDGGGH